MRGKSGNSVDASLRSVGLLIARFLRRAQATYRPPNRPGAVIAPGRRKRSPSASRRRAPSFRGPPRQGRLHSLPNEPSDLEELPATRPCASVAR
jgi:hypothetical protein